MTDYTKLVEALRHCSHDGLVKCNECKYGGKEWPVGCEEEMMRDAAAAIEELQDKVVELQEELNDADVAADDNARQIEALEAEVKILKVSGREAYFEGLAAEPKRGEWELIDGAEPMRWGCSRCKYLSWETSSYCPRCGAKMEE